MIMENENYSDTFLYDIEHAEINFGAICRLCLEVNSASIPIFNKEEAVDISLAVKILKCGGIEVLENDSLPSNICSNCFDEINRTHSFQERCRKTDITLKKCASSKVIELTQTNALNLCNELEGNAEVDFSSEWFNGDSNHFLEAEGLNTENEERDENHNQEICSTAIESISEKRKETSIELALEIRGSADGSPEITEERKKKEKKVGKPEKVSRKRTIYKCDLCSKVCNSHSSLYYHRQKHSGHKPHQCSFCPKTFHQKCTLVKHERTHTGQRPFACNKCDRTFTQDSNLKFHEMSFHSDEKVFCCHICGKRFSLGHNLKEHIKIHTGARERRFVCEECGKSFYHRSHLTSHGWSHRDEKPHQCDQCDKRFIKKSHLKQHAQVHTDVKSYECKECGKCFRSSSNLKAHSRTHVKCKYNCTLCSKEFPSKSMMVSHIEEAHVQGVSICNNNLSSNVEKPHVLEVINVPSDIIVSDETISLLQAGGFTVLHN